VNKIWNAARLVLMNCEDAGTLPEIPEKPASLWHRWILSRLQRVTAEVEESIKDYHFNQYAHALYHFVWREFCDWYLEMIKQDFYGEDPQAKALAQAVSLDVLRRILLLLHPIMPFVTEEIWQKLPQTQGSIMNAALDNAQPERLDDAAEEMTDGIMTVVSGIRNIRGEMNISPALRADVVCLCEDETRTAMLREHGETVKELARLSSLETALVGERGKPRVAASTIAKGIEVYVLLEGILDFESESRRLQKELTKVDKEYSLTQKKLANEDFLSRAPQEVIEKENEKAGRLGEKLEKLRSQLERVKSIRDAQGKD
jgi:valyl-tRNA synthetase